jgi:hypothetical protein
MASNFEEVDKILQIIAKNGLFEEGVELIGSWCFYLYQKYLGVEKFPFMTLDTDFLIPNPFRGKEHKNFVQQIEELGYLPDFDANGSLGLSGINLRIDFITPLKGKGEEKSVKVEKLGFNAIPLRYVDLLLEDAITLDVDGIAVRMPNPLNFCLHKLIVASLPSRRSKPGKRQKDSEQAIYASEIVDQDKLKARFTKLPHKWRALVEETRGWAKDNLPLSREKVEKLIFTLHIN